MKKSAAVECSETFRALKLELAATREARDDLAKRVVELRDLRYAEEKKIARLNALENELKVLETAFDESQNHLGDALASAAKATREALEWKRLADHWEKQWNASNAERGGNAMRVKELESEMDRMKREHSEEVARLEGDLRRVVSKRDFHYSQSEAFREIALAAVGVKP